jgi:hypothetical protein
VHDKGGHKPAILRGDLQEALVAALCKVSRSAVSLLHHRTRVAAHLPQNLGFHGDSISSGHTQLNQQRIVAWRSVRHGQQSWGFKRS